jgi:anti-sigma factor RsiW
MNCRDAETRILAARDAAPSADEAAALASHLAACPRCQRLADDWEAARAAWRERDQNVVVPDAQHEWHAVRRRIRNSDTEETPAALHLAWSRLLRVALPVAAAAAVIFGVSTRWAQPPTPFTEPAVAQVDWSDFEDHFAFAAHAEYVETDNADASPFVYLDEESGWLVVWASDTTDNSSSI